MMGFLRLLKFKRNTNQLSSVYDRVRSINPIRNKIGAKIHIRIGISIFSFISFNNINIIIIQIYNTDAIYPNRRMCDWTGQYRIYHLRGSSYHLKHNKCVLCGLQGLC